MLTHIAFLRAVNVRPRWVRMERLRELLTDEGFVDVQTYIQSGNVRIATRIQSASTVRSELERLIQAEFGFAVTCILRTPQQLREVMAYAEAAESPLPDAELRRYITFCSEPIDAGAMVTLDAWNEPGERVLTRDREIHWWLAKPSHQAKLSNARIERLVGVATTRDLKVVRSLAERWGT